MARDDDDLEEDQDSDELVDESLGWCDKCGDELYKDDGHVVNQHGMFCEKCFAGQKKTK